MVFVKDDGEWNRRGWRAVKEAFLKIVKALHGALFENVCGRFACGVRGSESDYFKVGILLR